MAMVLGSFFSSSFSSSTVCKFFYACSHSSGSANAKRNRRSKVLGVLGTDTEGAEAGVRRSHQSGSPANKGAKKEEDVYIAVRLHLSTHSLKMITHNMQYSFTSH
jgi:hypothetical protein